MTKILPGLPVACAVMIAAVLTAAATQNTLAAENMWRHGIFVPKSDAGILLMASKGGFAEKQGLKIEVVPMKDDPLLIRALLAGEVDSIEGGAGIALSAGSRNADVKILGCHWPGLPHGIFVRNGIASVQDLRGGTIAIAGPGGLPDLLIRALLEKFGVPASQVHFANLGGDVERFKALSAGVVDATVVSMEYVPVAAKQNVKLLVAGREILPNYLRTCIETTGKVLETRRSDAIAFVAAEISALRYAMSHRAETTKLTREVAQVSPEDPRPEYIFDDTAKSGSVDTEMTIPLEKLAWMQDQLLKIGSLQAPVDLTRIVDGEIRERALERLRR